MVPHYRYRMRYKRRAVRRVQYYLIRLYVGDSMLEWEEWSAEEAAGTAHALLSCKYFNEGVGHGYIVIYPYDPWWFGLLAYYLKHNYGVLVRFHRERLYVQHPLEAMEGAD